MHYGGRMINKTIEKIVRETLAIEQEEANRAGALGYMARVFTQATLPHNKVDGNEYIRNNGLFTLSMMSPSSVGIPYGAYPRLLLAWLTTEAVRTKSSDVILGTTLSAFMRELGLLPTGGRWGTITRLREQMIKLFSSSISYEYHNDDRACGLGMKIAKAYDLWWNPKMPDQAGLWQSHVTLSSDFFEEIIERPIPIDMRVLRVIKQSPMRLDIYCWLTYRMSYLRQRTEIPWPVLQLQFGANYTRTRAFKAAFSKHLNLILPIYHEAKVEDGQNGLILHPSKTHVKRRAIA